MLKTMLIVTGAAAAVASADTVNLRYLGAGRGETVRIYLDDHAMNVFAGQLRHEFTDGDGILQDYNGEQITYCTDLTQYVDRQGTEYEVRDLTELPDAPHIPHMSAFQAQALRDLFAFAAGKQVSESVDNAFAAAFQLMIWEIVWDLDDGEGVNDLSLHYGNFRAKNRNGDSLPNAIKNAFSNLRGALGMDTNDRTLIGLASDCAQDQLFQVPTPGSMALVGMAGLLAAKRRRK